MIKTYIHMDDDDAMVITIRAHINSNDHFENRVETDIHKAEQWIQRMHGDIMADTILKFIHQRRQALRHFGKPNWAMENSLTILEVRFDGAKQFSLRKLVERIYEAREHLVETLPPPFSIQSSWILTIDSLIKQCHRHYYSIERSAPASKTYSFVIPILHRVAPNTVTH